MDLSASRRNYNGGVMVVLLSICISLGFVCSPAKADLISDICALSKDVQYCSNTIRATPGSNTTDLAGLGQLVLGLATSKVLTAQHLIQQLEEQAADQKMKDTLHSCLGIYADCQNVLIDCSDLLGKKDYSDLGDGLSDAKDDLDGCDQSFSDFQPALPEPDQLKQASAHLQVLIGAVGVIATKLGGGGVI